MKSGLYVTTGDDTSVAGWGRCSIALPKAKLAPKMWWSLLGVWVLSPGEALTSEECAQQTYETHPNLKCLQLALGESRKDPVLHADIRLHIIQPAFSKAEHIGLRSLPCLTSHS